MKLMGIGDEGAAGIEDQIRLSQELGWRFIELRAVEVPGGPKANVHELPEEAFNQVARKLTEANLRTYCFGSAIMNWARRITDPFSITLEEVKRTIPRMRAVGANYVRIMSFKPGDDEHRIPAEVFDRVREVTQRFLDAGIQPVHENCMNYGGMSWKHALELLDKVPGLQWVFDTANPVFNPDRSKAKPWPRQDAWEFWEHVRDHVTHIHIKDALWDDTRQGADYCWPGEGQGRIREILSDALKRGYEGGLSIEPHMVVVFHDVEANPVNKAALMGRNFVEYGRRLEKLIVEAKTEVERCRMACHTNPHITAPRTNGDAGLAASTGKQAQDPGRCSRETGPVAAAGG
jgi:sugar phosphate isomerase/epimerase